MAFRIYCIGESVLDLIFKNGKPYKALPGGSALNTSVSLGRSGCDVEFISETGKDKPGEMISHFLSGNRVGTKFLSRFDDGKTALALAFLDPQGNASYSFYRNYPKQRLAGKLPEAGKGDIILFGSVYAITKEIRGKLTDWIRKGRERGAFVIYDPNFRKAHRNQENVPEMILENFSLAHLVRGSDEDFLNAFSLRKADKIRELVLSCGCQNLVITRAAEPVTAWFGGLKAEMNFKPAARIVSTVGAGDSFNAGFICSLSRFGKGDPLGALTSERTARQCLLTGLGFSRFVCSSRENYISAAYGNKMKA
jgi:fructokinase